ncbi:hypothetical protein BGZ65_011462, partial [Modicella reniformis]
MVNSIQIVRWPRYHPKQDLTTTTTTTTTTTGGDQDDIENCDGEETTATADSDVESDDYDQKEGYPTRPDRFDHYMVTTLNSDGLLIAALPDHPNPWSKKGRMKRTQYLFDDDDHVLKFEDNTWIKNGFNEALNDAKVSPNGRWIAVVGDCQRVWTIEVTHLPETEEQMASREERRKHEKAEDVESDSEYVTEGDSMSDEEINQYSSSEPQTCRDKRPSTDMDDSWKSTSSSKKAKSSRVPRLLHHFGKPVEMRIPDKVLFGAKAKRVRRWQTGYEPYVSQYVAWNATSTKFAHSSDSCSRVLVWSMPSREIVCCVDIGGTGYAIDFHPKLENLFAVANWYGFVHVVDLTGCCVGDEDLVPDDVHYNGQTQHGPGLTVCEGPHYEEKHDILMLSFRGEKDKTLRILDAIRGLGWSTDGRHLYVATLRRVLRYELADNQIRIPSLFQMCAHKVREWKERIANKRYTCESNE